MSKSEKLYKDSPRLERDDDGDMAVKKPSEADKENAGLEGAPVKEGEKMDHSHERREVHHKHVKERLDLHNRHETEHAMAGETDKKQLHKKHETELKDMHERHHSEVSAMHRRHEKNSKE